MSRSNAVRFVTTTLLLIFVLITRIAVSAELPADDHAALEGLTETRAIFDITTADPKKLKFYLGLIEETAASVRSQGATPVFVLAFRGPATRYMSTDHSQLDPEQAEVADQIAQVLQKLSKLPNVKLEQCAVAARVLKVDRNTIHPVVKVVGNSWISLMGYQNKGYALIPVR